MSRRERRRQRRESGIPPASNPAPAVAAPTTPAVVPSAPAAAQPAGAAWVRDPWVWVVALGAVALVLFSAYKFWPPSAANDIPLDLAKNSDRKEPPEKVKPPAKGDPDDFLSEFTKDADSSKESGSGVLASRDLERQFQTLVEISDQLRDLKKRGTTPGAFASDEELHKALDECDRLADQLTRKARALEDEVGKARQARPRDAVPRWLTGELLMIVEGEPEAISPHLEFAVAQGLHRPRLAGSLARTQLEANRFADSYDTAGKALEEYGQDRYLWDAFARAALSSNQFEPLIDRLARAFPAGLPAWAQAHRRSAEVLQAKWVIEQKIRRAEALAGDLPRVRLVIEHRRFARDEKGIPLTTIESTGRGEIVLELFENEAPLTVANFIDLVTRKFYDGTSFHLAVPATAVAGGDPNTRNEDRNRDDDGAGGPGYVIADEYQAKSARNHFRGSISMVRTKPHTAGSQFFFSLAPAPEMDGNFTVFGHIVEGQEVADRITRGRTTRKVGPFGRIIPGDLLVRAEILRKRPHEYRAVKE